MGTTNNSWLPRSNFGTGPINMDHTNMDTNLHLEAAKE